MPVSAEKNSRWRGSPIERHENGPYGSKKLSHLVLRIALTSLEICYSILIVNIIKYLT